MGLYHIIIAALPANIITERCNKIDCYVQAISAIVDFLNIPREQICNQISNGRVINIFSTFFTSWLWQFPYYYLLKTHYILISKYCCKTV